MKKIIILLFSLLILIGYSNKIEQNKIISDSNPEKTITKNEQLNEIVNNSEKLEEIINNNEKPKESANDASQTQYYKVVKVIDGDTITVNIDGTNEVIRIIGADTPETKDPRKLVECFGFEASEKAKELLSDQWVELESDQTQGNKDKYDRFLRYVRTKEGLFYNLEIIKQGYAHEYTYNLPYKYQKEFKEAELYARNNKLGLWADGACDIDDIPAQEVVSPATQEPMIEAQSEPSAVQSQCECLYNQYNCGDFITHAEAQRFMNAAAELVMMFIN
ncbi:MAG: micrococcal nuclease [Parcubacteria group bacterium Athens1014_10]|nr:MAG: micrococcal nuclease [Parcubacteria group bacterium Athens1014_10]TSD05168.1 MAG: micrococcal nuclease [Parcubacteria group bacterium Athens0714_12]